MVEKNFLIPFYSARKLNDDSTIIEDENNCWNLNRQGEPVKKDYNLFKG